MEVSQKTENRTAIWSSSSTLGCVSKKMKTLIQKDTYTSVFIAAFFSITQDKEAPKCLSTDEWMKMWYVCVCVYIYIMVMFSHVRLFANPWTVTRQAPLSMWISRQEYWSGLPFIPPGSLPDPGFEPVSPMSPALAGRFFTVEPPGNPYIFIYYSAIKKNENFAICKNMDGLRGYYAKWN